MAAIPNSAYKELVRYICALGPVVEIIAGRRAKSKVARLGTYLLFGSPVRAGSAWFLGFSE
jgi:hypothetical protein